METAKKIIKTNEFVLFFLIFAVIIFFGLLNPRFFVLANIVQYLNSGVVLGFLTFGLSATIISGNFDFSVGAMCGFGTVIISQLMVMELPFVAVLFLSMLIMMLFGVFNGFLVGTLRIPGLLVTLGTSSLYYGIALVMTGGQAISVMHRADYAKLEFFGKSDLGTLPFGIILLAIVFVLSLLLLNYSSWGRRLILIGSSGEGARFAGINIKKDVLLAHVYSALMCFIGAIVLCSRMASGRADVGNPYVLDAVSAAVFGGISIKGGEGNIAGALLGVCVFSLLTSGFTMINISQYYRQVVAGVMLITVLFLRNYKEIFNKA